MSEPDASPALPKNSEGGSILTDDESAALAIYLAGRALIDYEYGDWDEVPELAEGAWNEVYRLIVQEGVRMINRSHVNGVDARWVYGELT